MGMTVEHTQETLMAYIQALVAHEAYANYFSDDVVYRIMNNGHETRGPSAVQQRISTDHSPAAELRLKNTVFGEGKAAIEVDFVSADGSATPYSVLYDLADGKITSLRIYFAGNLPE